MHAEQALLTCRYPKPMAGDRLLLPVVPTKGVVGVIGCVKGCHSHSSMYVWVGVGGWAVVLRGCCAYLVRDKAYRRP